MPAPSCADVSLDNSLKPDGNSYAYCLAAEIRALKTKNLQPRQVSEGGTGANNAASAIENLTSAASALPGQVLTKNEAGYVVWSTPAAGGGANESISGRCYREEWENAERLINTVFFFFGNRRIAHQPITPMCNGHATPYASTLPGMA